MKRERLPSDYLLRRLARLCRLRVQEARSLNERGQRLMDRCIVATLKDCGDLGRHSEAVAIVNEMNVRLLTGGGL